MGSSSRLILRSDSAHWLRSEPENCALPSRDAGETADQPDADVGERVEVEGRAVGRAGQLQRGHPARPVDVVDLRRSARRARRRRPSTIGCPCRDRCGAPGCARRRRASPGGRSGGSRRRAGCRSPTRRRPARRPSASWPGLRYVMRRERGRSPGGTTSASLGNRAMLQAPAASTTVRQCHVAPVGRDEVARRRMRCTDVTVVSVSTGAEIDLGVAVDERDRPPASSGSRRDRRPRSRSPAAGSASSASAAAANPSARSATSWRPRRARARHGRCRARRGSGSSPGRHGRRRR